mgnify:CR=1 FL=1
MNESPVDASGDVDDRVELRKGAWVMALYVAVCLLAALTAVAEKASDGHVRSLTSSARAARLLGHFPAPSAQ